MRRRDGESGQTLVEFGIICSALFLFVFIIIDCGRMFFQFTAVSAAARYGARWGSVVGGSCLDVPISTSSLGNDWCNNWGNSYVGGTDSFWNVYGNYPLQGASACPTGYDSSFTGYYTVSGNVSSTTTTILGAVAERFDTSNTSGSQGSSSPLLVGGLTPGFDLSHTYVCIQLNGATDSDGTWTVKAGDSVAVFVYAPAQATDSLDPVAHVNLVASSQYQVE
ncbi:MAG TPA: TadE/TadG family type IV pilus assembly protein [Chloroflexota bacterium]|nr:TadE/TadG family type IV pilus assembly protein [Chloroflexota bacterium]